MWPIIISVIVVWLIAIIIALVLLWRYDLVSRSRARLSELPMGSGSDAGNDTWFLPRWLFLSGYRQPFASAMFIGVTIFLFLLGFAAAVTLTAPGGVIFNPQNFNRTNAHMIDTLQVVIWLGCLLPASAPFWLVRASRRRIVQQVEQDLPSTLDLLAAMLRSGLSFDDAMNRTIGTLPRHRPLTRELIAYQREKLAGRPRPACLRRVDRNLNVQSVKLFVSSMIQADQAGSGVADIVLRQADEIRNRRRERALYLAYRLPVKLIFPALFCFMPMVMLVVAGPTVSNIAEAVGDIARTSRVPKISLRPGELPDQ